MADPDHFCKDLVPPGWPPMLCARAVDGQLKNQVCVHDYDASDKLDIFPRDDMNRMPTRDTEYGKLEMGWGKCRDCEAGDIYIPAFHDQCSLRTG